MGTKNQLAALELEFNTVNLDLEENAAHASKLREQNFMAAPILEVDGVFYGNHNEITNVINNLAE